MRVLALQGGGRTYTSNVYLVLGDWRALSDVNTLVDTGRDPLVLRALEQSPTGVGKRAVEQVLLTHSHFDHVELLGSIRREFAPRVCAFGPAAGGVDHNLADGEIVPAGDGELEVIYTPGHSEDSICLYAEREGVLFAGDTPLVTNSPGASYAPGYVAALEKICSRDVRTIYFGHGEPLVEGCNERLKRSLEMVRAGSRRGNGTEQEVIV